MVDVRKVVNRRRRTMSSWIESGRFDLEAYIEFFEIPIKVVARDAKVLGYCRTSTYGSLSEFLSDHKMSSPITSSELTNLKKERDSLLKKNGYSDEALEAFGLWHAPSKTPFEGKDAIDTMLNKGYPKEVVRKTFAFEMTNYDFITSTAGKESAEVAQALAHPSEMESLLEVVATPPQTGRGYSPLTPELEDDLVNVWRSLRTTAGIRTREEGIFALQKLGIKPPLKKISNVYKRVKEGHAALGNLEFSQAVERLKNMTHSAEQKKPFYERDLYELTGLSVSTKDGPGEIERLLNAYKKNGTIVKADTQAFKSTIKPVDERYFSDPTLCKKAFEMYTYDKMTQREITQVLFPDAGNSTSRVNMMIKHYKLTHPDKIDRTALHINRNFDETRRIVRSAVFETAEDLFKQGKSPSEISKSLKKQSSKDFAELCPSANAIEAHLIEKGLIDPYENGEIEDTQIAEASFAAQNPGQFTEYVPEATTTYRKGSTSALLDNYGTPSYTEDAKTRNAVRLEILRSQNRAQAFLRANPTAMDTLSRTGDFEAAVAAARAPKSPLKIVCGKNRRAIIESAAKTTGKNSSQKEYPDYEP